jgi:c(7)-type cytochrome triheme protein
MTRQVAWGTPGRSEHYLRPRRPHGLFLLALVLAIVAAAALLLPQLLGLRGPLAPGSVTSAHAVVEARCQECHAGPAIGASDLRCQRCHDPSGAGRLTQQAHVLFGSRDPKQAAAAEGRRCASCHVEHGGRARRLAAVDQGHCQSCHFSSFGGHPEFAVLRTPSREVPGLKFSHERHVKELLKTLSSPAQTCGRCHEPQARDIAPLSFDRHCASCHAKEGSVGPVDPVPLEDAAPASGDAFSIARGRVSKPATGHRDPWVAASLRKLRGELDPDGYAAERGALLARLSQLRRRLALAAPLAVLDDAGLQARRATLLAEIAGAEARLAAQTGAAPAPADRLGDVAAASAAAGDATAATDARAIEALARSLPATAGGAIAPEEHEARRRELLAALDAVESADPSLRPRAEDLRRRVVSLVPGEEGAAILARVRDQRRAELLRLEDELELRRHGATLPVSASTAGLGREITAAIRETEERLAELPAAAPVSLGPEQRERKRQSLEVVALPCAKCHVIENGALARVRAAKPVMLGASFAHKPHLLQADCARCHAGIEASRESKDLTFKGVQSCRECHRAFATRQDCQLCHRYHPPGVP